MLQIAIVAFIIALIAGALGFTGVARGAASIAKFFFVLFIIVAIIVLILFFVGVDLLG